MSFSRKKCFINNILFSVSVSSHDGDVGVLALVLVQEDVQPLHDFTGLQLSPVSFTVKDERPRIDGAVHDGLIRIIILH
jgi:hypothetical protein